MCPSKTKRIPPHSYFDANAKRVADARDVRPADKDLLAAFMTIQEINQALRDPSLNLLRDFGKQSIIDLQVDVKKIINCLTDYQGNPRTGVREAENNMNKASQQLYKAQDAAEKDKRTAMSDAMIACGEFIKLAHGQLRHWENNAQKVRAQVPAQTTPEQSQDFQHPTVKQPLFKPHSKDDNPHPR